MPYDLTNPYELAKYIKNATKTTPLKAYIQGELKGEFPKDIKFFGQGQTWTLFGQAHSIMAFIKVHSSSITDYHLENDRRASAIPLLDYTKQACRIEPGAIIRDKVDLASQVVIMMGAVINIGACVGQASMIDMNAVLGARARVGDNCHIGAGAVLAGVLEPPSAQPVIVENGVLIGANAVILEGVHIGKNAVVAAGAVVTSDVAENTVVAGSPARFIKLRDKKTDEKTLLLQDLRT